MGRDRQRCGQPGHRWGRYRGLADDYGTPLHVVNRSRLLADYELFESSFRSLYPKTAIGYSYKTNPLPGVLKCCMTPARWRKSFHILSYGSQLNSECRSQRIIFNGPGKTRDAIEMAVHHGIGMINIDGLSEIDEIAQAARGARRQTERRRASHHLGRMVLAVRARIASGSALEAFRRIRRHEDLVPAGLHFHLGTGIRDVGIYLQAVREMLEFAQAVRSELGIQVTQLDLGGGFGVADRASVYRMGYSTDFEWASARPGRLAAAALPHDYAREIIMLVRKYYPSSTHTAPTVIFEPGRAITSSSQCLVLRVLAVKDDQSGARNVILDGGKNIAMPLGYEVHELLAVNGAADARDACYNFYGPLCHPGDLHFRSKAFRKLKAGDLVAIMDAGAYFIPNQMNFSHPRPPVVMVKDGTASLLRQRESFDDVVRLDRLV